MVTRKQIGFVLDSFLLFLVALFIYRLGHRSGKKKCEESEMYVTGGPPYPTGGMLRRTFDFTETHTTPPIEFVPPSVPCKTGGSKTTWIEGLNEHELRKGTFKKHITTGLRGDTSPDDGRGVYGVADHTDRTDGLLGDDKRTTGRREEEDGYYDERQ